MAKKRKKTRARQAPRMYARGAPPGAGLANPAMANPAAPALHKNKARLTGKQLREEYWYVYNDLKRIAVISGVLFAILIILSFFL